MRTHRIGSLFLCSLVLCLPLAASAERIEQTFSAAPDTVLEIRNLNGDVTVHAWNEPTVKVVAVRRSRAVEVHMEQNANRIHVHTHLLTTSSPVSDRVVDVEVWARPDVHLMLQLESGTLRVEDFVQDVNVKTVAASVALHNLAGLSSVETLNGAIRAERCSGRLEATSISGSLYLDELSSRFVVAKTTSGDIFYRGSFQPGGSYDFLNHEGAIELRVPVTASFELRANSVKGEVINELPITTRQHGRLPQPSTERSLLGTVHTGDAIVRATSFSGTIRLLKQ